jgi:hypothetical protein
VTDTWKAIARRHLPELSDGELEYVIWNHTGFPIFWTDPSKTPVENFEAQIAEYAAQIAKYAAQKRDGAPSQPEQGEEEE